MYASQALSREVCNRMHTRPHIHKSVWMCDKLLMHMELLATRFSYSLVPNKQGWVKKTQVGWRFLLNSKKRGSQNKQGGWNFKKSVIGNK